MWFISALAFTKKFCLKLCCRLLKRHGLCKQYFHSTGEGQSDVEETLASVATQASWATSLSKISRFCKIVSRLTFICSPTMQTGIWFLSLAGQEMSTVLLLSTFCMKESCTQSNVGIFELSGYYCSTVWGVSGNPNCMCEIALWNVEFCS